MPLLDEFGTWVWARHQNLLSWYIRPPFAVPPPYYSYHRSSLGIAGTLIALATSMFWFPLPKQLDARVAEFLRLERAYVAGRGP